MPRMTLYGVPKSAKRNLTRIWRGKPGDILWQLLVIAVIVVAAGYLLLAGGVYGAVIGGLLLTTLIADDVRKAVSDVFHRRWAELESPSLSRPW